MDKNAVFKNLLFDLDGTLTDPALGITSAAQYALCKMGIEVADRTTLTWLIGPPLIGSFEEGFGMTNLQALEALKHYREYFSEKGIFENEIYPGIAELLSDLKAAGRRVMVATSKPEDFTHRILEHFDIARYFDFVGGHGRGQTHKGGRDSPCASLLSRCSAGKHTDDRGPEIRRGGGKGLRAGLRRRAIRLRQP